VPEFNSGAMENVGCVTYNETYLYRGITPTLAKRLRFSITNLHELAHMWFGNLVTMKWWNDLWLNESFATFMSFLVMTKSPDLAYFDTAWVTFLTYKFWGITEDSLSSTHPIKANVQNTAEAESIFDGISYGKGSAFLKQFYNVMGHEAMAKGLKVYFSKFAWKNTELLDFVKCMEDAYEEHSDKSMGPKFKLSKWCDSWLTTSGVNILEPLPEFDEQGILKSLKLKQTCDLRGNNQLRIQKLDVALYDSDFKPHFINNVITSDIDEVIEVQVTFDKPVSAILVNVNDQGYCKVVFDPKSLSNFE